MTDTADWRAAAWTARAGAFCIDVLAGLGLALCLLLIGWSAPIGGWLWWACLLAAAVLLLTMMVNRWLLPAVTGWTAGRAAFGIAIRDGDGSRPGPWRLLLRDVAHLLDTLPFLLGWFWPLVDSRGRTFADLLVRTEALQVGPGAPTERRRVAGSLVTGAALGSLLVAGIGFLAVDQHQRVVAEAREQIALEGPKIVSDVLSYTAKTADEDFARAQGLVTEEYRPELTEQQDGIRKAGPVDNDYWVTDSAVLSADRDRATMLLLLQGQRGIAPNQRLITASLRVDFAKSRSDEWQVSGLTVLSPPKPTVTPAPPSSTPAPPKSAPAPPKSAPAPPKQGAGR